VGGRETLRLARRRAVYSFQKTTITREYLINTDQGWVYEVSVVVEMNVDVSKMYKCHAINNVDVFVDLIRQELMLLWVGGVM